MIHGLGHHSSDSFEISNMPHEILHFCQANAKRFFVTTTLDRENKQVKKFILRALFHCFEPLVKYNMAKK